MATLLSVETSGALCSVAIYASGRWFEDTRNVERLHNQVVLEILDALSAAAAVSRRGFDAVAFAAGPGSFTGIRIAAAVCQGVAFASGARAVPVSSSLALATAALRHPECPDGARRILTVTRSRRDAYYLAGYGLGAGAVASQRLPDRLHLGAEAPADLPGPEWVAVGHRPEWWPAERSFIIGVETTAVIVGELALLALERGATVDPAGALPVYVAGDSPWQPSAR
ncbi:MAG: tRNA (adenosine(37)-N6)-threonylcarbamoyltransferase complex dimerization subunit type 1 TsaB [Pseudomonadales bacterium]